MFHSVGLWWIDDVCFTISGSVQTPHTKICMRWRIKKWPKGHHSVVMIDLTEQDDGETDLILNQKDVPSGEVDRTLDGWSVNFWERIKLTFGFHAKIF